MQLFQPSEFRHVRWLWDDSHAATLDPIARLIYRSNLLGSDLAMTNTGGGNTSSKLQQADPLTADLVDVMWVKGSGGDLRTAKRENFASLYMHKLQTLRHLYLTSPDSGAKSAAEDRMVSMYALATFNNNPTASSIDTPLHAFIPFRHVDHTHPDAIIALAACDRGREVTNEIYGGQVAWVDWQRPGFDLAMKLEQALKQRGVIGIILGGHGLITWDDDERVCYQRSLSLVESAARYLHDRDSGERAFGGAKYNALAADAREKVLADVLPYIRGMVSQQRRFVATCHADDAVLSFVNSHDAARLADLGTSCPDHFLRTKIKPLYVAWDPATADSAALRQLLATGLEHYRNDYAAYYQTCRRPDSPPMRDSNPSVILIPGVGLIAWGKNKNESRTTAEFFIHAIQAMRGAEAIGKYVALARQEAFDIEYWSLEEAKLRRMPPDKAMGRNVAVVIGAGSGIGRAVAHRVACDGAHVVCCDLNKAAAETTAVEIQSMLATQPGVAGTGVAACGQAIGLACNITDRTSVAEALRQSVLAYGGIDHLIVTAGVFVPPDTAGYISDEKWRLTFDVNVLGAYLVADEARKVFANQQMRTSLVLTTSVNGVVSKKGSVAYDTSKAAANHLVRELAVELAPLTRVNGLAPATVVDGSAMFPRDRVISSLAKYQIAYGEDESTESLREKLAMFYAQRTLTRRPITPEDQAEVAYLISTDAFSKTTGQIFSVDGGLHEAFLR